MNNNYLVIDTETGGINPRKSSLLSIGLVAWNINKGIYDTSEIFIKHKEYKVQVVAQKINKFQIEDHELKAVSSKAVFRQIQQFLEKNFNQQKKITIIGHNVQFDVGFIKEYFSTNRYSYNNRFSHRLIDTNSIIKYLILIQKLPHYLKGLSSALKYFNIKIQNRHSALEDAIATAKLFEELLKLGKKNDAWK